MKRFVEGRDRRQGVLLPAYLDDYVSEENPVRVVEAFIDELDLAALGFSGVMPEPTGRPAYHPAVLLKIYLYGYLNQVQSSRRLEREAQRNIELMWLVGCLAPDFKTIADFRKDNGEAIRGVCGQFIELCRRLKLFTLAVVAIDGSKFKAVNNRDKNFTVAKVGKRMEQVDASIARYLAALDRADREEGDIADAKANRINEKIAGLRRQMQLLKEMEQQVGDAADQQVSSTDPEARSMATSGKGTGIVGYNVQTAVDAEHHLIVAHHVTKVGHDRTQLMPMALKAQGATGNKEITVLADRGYFNGDQVLSCENTGVMPCVPKTLTSGNAKRGLFTGQDFIYDAEKDHYTCPAGQHLTRGRVRSDRRLDVDHYRHLTACFTCPLKPRCTPDKLKRVKRWKHEGVLDAMQARLDRMPDAMGSAGRPLSTRSQRSNHGWVREADDRDLRRRAVAAGDPSLSARSAGDTRCSLDPSQPPALCKRVFPRPRSLSFSSRQSLWSPPSASVPSFQVRTPDLVRLGSLISSPGSATSLGAG